MRQAYLFQLRRMSQMAQAHIHDVAVLHEYGRPQRLTPFERCLFEFYAPVQGDGSSWTPRCERCSRGYRDYHVANKCIYGPHKFKAVDDAGSTEVV